jgi:tripartite-type tricarboxylate transporter receptor subunit TctC
MVSTSPACWWRIPSLPAGNLRELVALAKARPGKLNFAIGGVGSSVHLAGEAFKMMSGTYIVNIPYKGTAPAIQDVLAGQVELMFANVGNAQAHVRAGKLKALGVTSLRSGCRPSRTCRRSPRCCPATSPAPGSACSGRRRCRPNWPSASATRRGRRSQSAEVKKRIEFEGATPVGNTPDEFARFVHEEIARWAKVVKYSGAKPD